MLFEQFLVPELFAYLMVFCRVGTGIMLLPGVGEAYVSTRIRLLFAIAFTLAVGPVLAPDMPPPPAEVIPLFSYIIKEIIVGLFLGGIARMIISAMHTAGTIIATQSGLASAMMLDITQTSQSTAITNLLSITAVTVMFVMDLHYLLLAGLISSYDVFPAGATLPADDMMMHAVRTMSQTFAVSMQIAAPHIVIGTVVYLAAGVLSRLMPNMQIFFILMPPQILVSLFILMVTVSGAMLWYMSHLEKQFGTFVQFTH
jgi:flagellar biosynthetic protein FliR